MSEEEENHDLNVDYLDDADSENSFDNDSNSDTTFDYGSDTDSDGNEEELVGNHDDDGRALLALQPNFPSTPSDKVFGTPELLAELLKYLPVPDLLSCRFMNHAWNKQIIPVLIKRKFYISITKQTYRLYEFLMNCSPSASRIGLGCSLILNDSTINQSMDYVNAIQPMELYPLTLKLQRLKPGFLKHLTINLSEFERVRELRSMLRLIRRCGSGLHFLRIDLCDQRPVKDRDPYLTNSRILTHISLPELETFHFQCNNTSLSTLFSLLLIKAPKLQNLIVNIDDDGAETNSSGHNSTGTSWNCLTKLTVQSAPYGIKLINNMQLPALDTLKINFQVQNKLDEGVAARFSQFLGNNCPLLRILDLYFYGYSADPTDLVNTVLPQFEMPTLPNLTHFGCHVENDEETLFFAVRDLADLEQKLPKLTSASVTPGTYFCVQDMEYPDEIEIDFSTDHSAVNYLKFDGVSTLRLQDWFIDNHHFDPTVSYDTECNLGTIRQLSLLFPNLRKVTIAPLLQKGGYTDGLLGLEEMKRIWTRTIETTLKVFPALEELEIENCFEDYFTEIWIRRHQGVIVARSCQFPGLTRLRLPTNNWFGREGTGWFLHKYPILDLLNLVQLFPNLKSLEIEAQFIAYTKEEVEKKLSCFQLPGLNISLILGS